MPSTPINLGTNPNDGTGDTLRAAGQKININFSALDAAVAGKAATDHQHTTSQVTDFAEAVQDVVGGGFVVGAGTVSVSYNDAAGTFTITGAAGGADAGVYGTSSPHAVVTPPGTNGRLRVQQPGGVAGTDCVDVYHDGTQAVVRSLDGPLYVPGVLVIGSDSANFGARLTASAGMNQLTLSTGGNGQPLNINLGGITDANYKSTYSDGSWVFGSARTIRWGSSDAFNAVPDIGLARAGAGGVAVTDGSTGGGFLQSLELASDPAAPPANGYRLFARDNGSGKTQLCVRFATGAVQVIATEP